MRPSPSIAKSRLNSPTSLLYPNLSGRLNIFPFTLNSLGIQVTLSTSTRSPPYSPSIACRSSGSNRFGSAGRPLDGNMSRRLGRGSSGRAGESASAGERGGPSGWIGRSGGVCVRSGPVRTSSGRESGRTGGAAVSAWWGAGPTGIGWEGVVPGAGVFAGGASPTGRVVFSAARVWYESDSMLRLVYRGVLSARVSPGSAVSSWLGVCRSGECVGGSRLRLHSGEVSRPWSLGADRSWVE